MGLFKSFFPGLAGNLDASLGDQYAPSRRRLLAIERPGATRATRPDMTRFKPHSASFDVQGERENIKH